MKVSLKNTMVSAATISVLIASNAQASDPTPITECGFQINEPGKYEVVNNLFCDPNHPYAISVSNTNNVEIDLQNHQLRMPGGESRGIGIYLQNSRQVEIKAEKDAFIYNFQTAISLYGDQSDGQLLENRDVKVEGGGMRLMNNDIGVLVRLSRDIDLEGIRTENNERDWLLTSAKELTLDKINLPANQYE